MRIRKFLIGLLVATLGLGAQTASALDTADLKPLIPVTDPAAQNWFQMRKVIEMSEDVLVVMYKENEFFFKASIDGGETWGLATEPSSFGFWTNGVDMVKINNTQFLVGYRDNSGTYWIKVGTVDGTTISFGTPTAVYTPVNDISVMLSSYPLLVSGNDWWVYLPLINYTNFNGDGELVEFHSDDQGATWTRASTLVEASEHRMADNLKAFVLEDGRRVILGVLSDTSNNRYTFLKLSNGSGWDVLSTDAELLYGNGETVNNGKGLALMGIGVTGHELHTYIWEDIDDQPIKTKNQSDAWAGGQGISTNGKNTIAVQLIDKMNPPNSYGGRSAEVLVTKDFGATWATNTFETIPDERPAGEFRLYGNFIKVGDDGGIIYGYGTNDAVQPGMTMKIAISENQGTTWTEPLQIMDGYASESWGWAGTWHSGKSPALIGNVAIDLDNNYYMGLSVMKFATPVSLPEKLVFKSSFKYGKLQLSAKDKSDLLAWADQIADGTSVVVYAPDFTKADQKRKAYRSLARAQAVTKVLRSSGLKVTVVRGKVVKKTWPLKGRTVTTQISTK